MRQRGRIDVPAGQDHRSFSFGMPRPGKPCARRSRCRTDPLLERAPPATSAPHPRHVECGLMLDGIGTGCACGVAPPV
jgi:hypothetical protein